jgi:galactose oxidase
MRPFTALALTAFSFVLISAQITQCPTTETSVTDSKGGSWLACANTDYQGNTMRVIWNISSQKACVSECSNQNGCNKVVWDKQCNACHLKGDGQNWVAQSQQFDTLRLAPTIVDRQPITKCLQTESTIRDSSGGVWTVCRNSDYWGNTIRIAWGITSMNNCQNTCFGENGCTRAVYDAKAGACHLKGDGQDWRSSTNTFDTVRLTSKGGF